MLTRGDFPTGSCLLGSDWKGTSTFDEIAKLLRDVSYITPDLDPTECPDPGSMAALGCDDLQIAVSLLYKGEGGAMVASIQATFSEEFPNLPPILEGHPGFDEVEILCQKSQRP